MSEGEKGKTAPGCTPEPGTLKRAAARKRPADPPKPAALPLPPPSVIISRPDAQPAPTAPAKGPVEQPAGEKKPADEWSQFFKPAETVDDTFDSKPITMMKCPFDASHDVPLDLMMSHISKVHAQEELSMKEAPAMGEVLERLGMAPPGKGLETILENLNDMESTADPAPPPVSTAPPTPGGAPPPSLLHPPPFSAPPTHTSIPPLPIPPVAQADMEVPPPPPLPNYPAVPLPLPEYPAVLPVVQPLPCLPPSSGVFYPPPSAPPLSSYPTPGYHGMPTMGSVAQAVSDAQVGYSAPPAPQTGEKSALPRFASYTDPSKAPQISTPSLPKHSDPQSLPKSILDPAEAQEYAELHPPRPMNRSRGPTQYSRHREKASERKPGATTPTPRPSVDVKCVPLGSERVLVSITGAPQSLGLMLDEKDMRIIGVRENTVALEHGLGKYLGWRIVAVNGSPCTSLNALRRSPPETLELVREELKVPPINDIKEAKSQGVRRSPPKRRRNRSFSPPRRSAKPECSPQQSAAKRERSPPPPPEAELETELAMAPSWVRESPEDEPMLVNLHHPGVRVEQPDVFQCLIECIDTVPLEVRIHDEYSEVLLTNKAAALRAVNCITKKRMSTRRAKWMATALFPIQRPDNAKATDILSLSATSIATATERDIFLRLEPVMPKLIFFRTKGDTGKTAVVLFWSQGDAVKAKTLLSKRSLFGCPFTVSYVDGCMV